tara:strand:+ start:4309 stop:4548 length:240 start_codon:yes stop_codon:yes gene_type:complete
MSTFKSTISLASPFKRTGVKGVALNVFALPERMWEVLIIWQHRLAMRHALTRMEPYLLNDMGISPEDAAREAAKPFWQA